MIAEVFAEDSGMFTCTASNKYGTVSSSAALKVKGKTPPPSRFLSSADHWSNFLMPVRGWQQHNPHQAAQQLTAGARSSPRGPHPAG